MIKVLNASITISAVLIVTFTTAQALANTVTYVLEDVWLLPDISHHGQPAQQMTGTFQWTYDEGHFENGSGHFTEFDIPWYGHVLGSMEINIGLSSIEFTLPVDAHDLGVDLTLFLVEPLSLNHLSAIDTKLSIFEIQNVHIYQGHVVSGNIVIDIPHDTCIADLTDDGNVNTHDLIELLAQWGTHGPADLDESGAVDTNDLLILFANWGPC